MSEYGVSASGEEIPIEVGSVCPFEAGERVRTTEGEPPLEGTVARVPTVPVYLREGANRTCAHEIVVDVDGGGKMIGSWHTFEAIE